MQAFGHISIRWTNRCSMISKLIRPNLGMKTKPTHSLQNILKKYGNYLCSLVTLCLVTKITKSLLNEKCVSNIVKQFWWYVLESWDLWLYENGVTIRFSMNWLRGQFSQFSRYVRLSVFLPVCPIARNRQFCQNC